MAYREPEYRRRGREQRENKQRNADTQAKEAAQDARIARVETALNSVVARIEAYTDEETPQNRKKVSREWWEIRALIAAAAVGVAAIWFGNHDSMGQRMVMQAQVLEMKNDRRAWIGPTIISLDTTIEEGKPITYGIAFQNTGKEPSIDGNVKAEFAEFIDAPSEGVSWVSRVPNIINTVCDRTPIMPGYLTVYPSNGAGITTHFAISGPIQMKGIIEAKRSFMIQGCYAYMAAGQRRESAFCYYLEPNAGQPSNSWQFKFCPTGNYAN